MADETSIEEVYWNMKIDVLLELREILVRDIQPHKYFDYLRSKRILDKDDCDDILAERSARRQAGVFLDILAQKGPEAFDEFCEALRRGKTQLHLLQKLLKAFEVKRNQMLETYPSTVPCPEVSPPGMHYVHNMTLSQTKCLPCPGDPGALSLPQDGKEASTTSDGSVGKLAVDLPGDLSEGKVPADPPPPYTE